MKLTPAARALILEFEGMDQPARWPGASSGITLGHGFDLGYATRSQFREAWARYLKPEHVTRLEAAIGVTGHRAKALAPRFTGITLTVAEADEVFTRCTIPRWLTLTEAAFPGVGELPDDAEGALLSLCFNRGTSMLGSRRTEMREIRAHVARLARDEYSEKVACRLIAKEIRSMKRLWPVNTPTGRGLQRRREAEAKLVLSSIGE